jgi:ribosomal protein S18 acetylase RimI-like enzyme
MIFHMNLNIEIREIDKAEIFQLDNFLYEAIFIPEGQEKIDREVTKVPELSRYIKNFGQKDDICLVAVLDGNLLGAIWTRIYPSTEPGYAYVDSKTPELSMSVLQDYRQKGIGTHLLKAMIHKLVKLDYEQVSLSVDKQNYAFRLYQKFGFVILDSDEKSAIMIKDLRK